MNNELDETTTLLEKLKQLSEYQDKGNIFQQNLRRLAEKYASRPALMSR